jgi:hypothetical protein
MTELWDAYRWYRQQDPRKHGGRVAIYPARLACVMARHDVANGKTRYPRTVPFFGGTWQALDTMPAGRSRDARAYYVDAWPEGWRDLGDATDLFESRDRHTGWYEDEFQDSLCKGRVLQLPGRHGKPVYVPGIYSTGSDGVTLYPLDRYDTAEDCARSADGYAERFAETAREYSDAWQAGSRAAEYASEANSIRADIVALISDLRTARRFIRGEAVAITMERLCAIARKRVSELLAEMATLREKRDALVSQYTWRDNGFRVNPVRDAFLEGLGG